MQNDQGEEASVRFPLVNELSQFVSFNFIFILSCLDNEQINFPETSYKANNLGNIVCASGSIDPANRVSTAYTSSYNLAGKFEFYIDSLDFNAIVSYDKATGGTNATTFTFDVIEPYSIGIFLQALQLAAANSGHPNYIEAPFLFTIEFIGYKSDGAPYRLPIANKHLPIKLVDMQMDVTTAGSRYKMEAIAWNEQALNDTNGLMKTDISISGKTVQEILQTGAQSLQAALNAGLKTISEKEKAKAVPNQIVILFPKELSATAADFSDSEEEESATVNPTTFESNNITNRLKVTAASTGMFEQATGDLNEIGASKMGFDMTTGGETALAADNFVYDEKIGRYKRGNLLFDKKSRTFMFAQGTSIVSAINEVILLSEYAKNAATSNKTDKVGMKSWFRIETQVYNLEPKEGNKGKATTPKILVYKVIPYKVHSSRFISPTSPATGYLELRKLAAKEYNYLYSGANTEILDFKINLQAAFFTSATADLGLNNKDLALSGRNSAGKVDVVELTPNSENLGAGSESGIGTPQQGSNLSYRTSSGGGPPDDPKALVAKVFQNALLNSDSEMLTLDLTIQGDPYFIADSGMGNFSDSGTGSFNITASGGIDYQSGEVDILINFRTPIDIHPVTGIADFGNSAIVEGFSGLYQVLTLDNHFKDGKFTQTLNLIRRPKQSEPVTDNEDPAVKQRASGSEPVYNEDGSVSTFRRNTETGELYDPGGGDDKGATVNPKTPTNKPTAATSVSNKKSENQYSDAKPEQTFYPEP